MSGDPDMAAVIAGLTDAQNVLDGEGEHASHSQEQIGRCVYCSCGQRVQGRLPDGLVIRRPRWLVRLSDGFVCWIGDSKAAAEFIAGRHDGAAVEQESS